MIVQLQHQRKTDRSKREFIAQADTKTQEEFILWSADVFKRHPLPKGFDWLICHEGAKEFICTINGGNDGH